jgi:hypothetical protein
MQALGKTPNDPLLQKMSPIQWQLCILNVIEDEKDLNKKISDLVDIAIRLLAGSPEGTGESQSATPDGYVGANPSIEKPDVHYEVNGASVRKVLSTEFDEIIKSGGQYSGFKIESPTEQKKEE